MLVYVSQPGLKVACVAHVVLTEQRHDPQITAVMLDLHSADARHADLRTRIALGDKAWWFMDDPRSFERADRG